MTLPPVAHPKDLAPRASTVQADVGGLLGPLQALPSGLPETLPGGGERLAVAPELVLTHVTLQPSGAGVLVSLVEPSGRIEMSPQRLSLPANWSDFGRLEMVVSSTCGLMLELVVMLPRGRLGTQRVLHPAESATLTLDLTDLPLAAGKRPLYEPVGLRVNATTLSGDEGAFTLERLSLLPRTEVRSAVVDTLGQRASTTWPGKAGSVDELRQRAAVEGAALARASRPQPHLDPHGGWMRGPHFAATGYFRVERDEGGRWWLVTPGGRPFWSIGTTGVRIGSVNDTAVARGREELYAALPREDEEGWFSGRQTSPTGDIDIEGNVHLYRWNVFRKYGSAEAWRARVLARWAAWGLNTFGAWSDELIMDQDRVPCTRFLRTRGLPDAGPATGVFSDVWDPRWSEAVDTAFARETAAGRGQSSLLGYFVDNEAPWREMRLLDFGPDACLRSAWLEFVRSRHDTVTAFNQAWGVRCTTWEEVRQLTTEAVRPAGVRLAEFEAHYADRYFSTVRRLLKKHDPDHLYLGCRFLRVPPADGIIAAAGRHVDVLSVNCYSRTPEPQAFSDWHRLSGGRPILIGEFHFPLASARQLPPTWEAFPEQERESMFATFVEVWARQPWSVGCHWYQHADQPVLGRHTDGENQTVGFVDLTDTPYEHLVRAARVSAENLYGWHARGEGSGP